jgi:hypothetical protein
MESFLKECKSFIEKDNLEGLQEYYVEYGDEAFAWEYIFLKLYLHACLKKKQRIVCWLDTLYPLFDPIQQIALRQMFPYARYLLAK